MADLVRTSNSYTASYTTPNARPSVSLPPYSPLDPLCKTPSPSLFSAFVDTSCFRWNGVLQTDRSSDTPAPASLRIALSPPKLILRLRIPHPCLPACLPGRPSIPSILMLELPKLRLVTEITRSPAFLKFNVALLDIRESLVSEIMTFLHAPMLVDDGTNGTAGFVSDCPLFSPSLCTHLSENTQPTSGKLPHTRSLHFQYFFSTPVSSHRHTLDRSETQHLLRFRKIRTVQCLY